MLNPDDQNKSTATAQIDSDERTANRPRSTAEVASDLDRSDDRSIPSDAPTTLFPEKEASSFRTRWTEIQTGFVDEPRRSVEQADALVAEVVKHLADSFAGERSKLEGQWGRGDDVSTEDLRVTLRRYRAFFDRLLNV
jgi:hypothetical protein